MPPYDLYLQSSKTDLSQLGIAMCPCMWPLVKLLNQDMWEVASRDSLFQTKGSKITRTKVEGSLSTQKVQRSDNEDDFFGRVDKKTSKCHIYTLRARSSGERSLQITKGDLFWFGDFNIWVSVEINLTIRCEKRLNKKGWCLHLKSVYIHSHARVHTRAGCYMY